MLYEQQDTSGLRKLGANSAYGTIGTYSSLLGNYLDSYHAGQFTDDISNIKDLQGKINHIRKEARQKYLEDLLYPEKALHCKIPSQVPIPTSSFKMHNTCSLQPNSLGNACWVFNPFFLTSTSSSLMTVNVDATLTGGAATGTGWTSITNFQTVPSGLYTEYRLVSCSLIVTCKASQLNTAGTFSMGIVMDPNFSVNSASVFNNVDDAYFSQIVPAKEGLRALWFPPDIRAEQFQTTGTEYRNFNFIGYAQGLPTGSLTIRIDAYMNFEAIADVTYMQYIPRSISGNISSDDKAKCYEEVQKNAIKIPDYVQIPQGKIGDIDITKNVDRLGDTIQKIGNVLDLLAAQKANVYTKQQGDVRMDDTPKGEWLNNRGQVQNLSESIQTLGKIADTAQGLFGQRSGYPFK